MMTFIMYGKYSKDALKGISAVRKKKAVELVRKFGGSIGPMYATLGEKDLVLIANFPGIEEAIQASVALNKLTGVSFTSSPAITVDKFDKLVGKA